MDSGLQEQREEIQEINLHASLGYFIASYSRVELAVTSMLAVFIKSSDFEAFHSITRGMDLGVKIERLRELCSTKNMIPNRGALDIRFDLLYTRLTKLRNRLSHSGLIVLTGNKMSAFATLNISHASNKKVQHHDTINQEQLRFCSNWCDEFRDDLISLVPLAKKHSTLTITAPHSMAPTDFHLKLDELGRRTNFDIPRQKSPKKS